MFPVHDENRPSRRPYVNYGLLVANTVIFFFFFLQGFGPMRDSIFLFGTVPEDIIGGERLWTLFTSMFMHADILHLFGNMIYLWVFGDNIEDALGHIKYLIFYLLGGLAATFTHIASLFVTNSTVGFTIPSVGASGAISAILGAYLLLYPRAKIRTLTFYFFITFVTVPAYYYLGFWFIYQLLMGVISLTGLQYSVAFWAHIGGFAAGLLVVKFFGIRPRLFRMSAATRRPVRPFLVNPQVRKPFVDLIMEKDKVNILAELPGVQQENINIDVSEWKVVISAHHGETRYHKQILLPIPVDLQVQDFYYRNGVLSFSLSKKER